MIAKFAHPAGAVPGFLLAALAGVALMMVGTTPANAASKSDHPSHSAAKDLFHADCSVCHGDNGAGSQIGKSLHAPDLRSSQVQSQSDKYLDDFIRHGHGAMPPFGSRLSSEQIESLVKYVRYLGASEKKK